MLSHSGCTITNALLPLVTCCLWYRASICGSTYRMTGSFRNAVVGSRAQSHWCRLPRCRQHVQQHRAQGEAAHKGPEGEACTRRVQSSKSGTDGGPQGRHEAAAAATAAASVSFFAGACIVAKEGSIMSMHKGLEALGGILGLPSGPVKREFSRLCLGRCSRRVDRGCRHPCLHCRPKVAAGGRRRLLRQPQLRLRPQRRRQLRHHSRSGWRAGLAARLSSIERRPCRQLCASGGSCSCHTMP